MDKDDNKYIVTEWLSKGNLRDLLISEEEKFTLQDLLFMYFCIIKSLLNCIFLEQETLHVVSCI